jgi:hypothetical protein
VGGELHREQVLALGVAVSAEGCAMRDAVAFGPGDPGVEVGVEIVDRRARNSGSSSGCSVASSSHPSEYDVSMFNTQTTAGTVIADPAIHPRAHHPQISSHPSS